MYNYFSFPATCERYEQTADMDVDRAIQAACLKLGYSSLRKEQARETIYYLVPRARPTSQQP